MKRLVFLFALLPLLASAQPFTFADPAWAGKVATPPAASSFTYYSADFDLADYLTRGADLTGVPDGDKWTLSVWVKLNSDSTNTTTYTIFHEAGAYLYVRRETAGQIQVSGWRSTPSAAQILSIQTANNALVNSSGWKHILVSVDNATEGKRHFYLSDADAISGTPVFTTGSVYDLTRGNYAVGAQTTGAAPWYGLMSEFWWDTNYLDITVEGNRRKFISAGGKPVDLGSDGSTPTGISPAIYLKTAVPNWESNSGFGGNFTENGALGDGVTDKP